jgi:hypothetical protein
VRGVARGGLQGVDHDLLVPIVRRAPGRGSSTSPSSPSATNRDRHLPTVGRETLNAAATSVLLAPSAQASTIRERIANYWALLGRRAHRASVSRSCSVTTNSAFGRPRTTTLPIVAGTALTSGDTLIRHGRYLITNLRRRTLVQAWREEHRTPADDVQAFTWVALRRP